MNVILDAGRTSDLDIPVAVLEALLADARSGGSRWLGEGLLTVARSKLQRGDLEAGCATLAQASTELAQSVNPDEIIAAAARARAVCDAALLDSRPPR